MKTTPIEGYTPVIFATLTQKNATYRQFSTGEAGALHLEEVQRFIRRMAIRTRVHLRFEMGWEDSRNQHSHHIILTDDERRFWTGLHRFDPERAWRWHQLDWQRFDPHHPGDVWSYVCKKHQHIPIVGCPNRQHRCRRGHCPHRISRLEP